MKILIDTNRIIAALSKPSTTRNILFDTFFEFITPDHTIDEIREHSDELKKKITLTDEEFDSLLALFFERITIIPESEFKQFLHECKHDISDPDDIPHLAACLATRAEGIWAHDPHFKEQHKAKVFTNIDMLRMSGKMKSD
ncbi:PIN domain-containing protein [Candidatus Woesearchaeota archaeon]|nr:PIN domain-containing protein [Candidatus Woesearchaeota archaeon]